ncbi:hypothetical protein AB6N23_12375 [Cellulomonas sp. 179-A 9B4 NHS]|uniref:hypothetical protein n=1 Tax=Cellulomonas sp. 179-A 9B4 NHS TaxID=3142379 RepID=UPI0039A3AFE6
MPGRDDPDREQPGRAQPGRDERLVTVAPPLGKGGVTASYVARLEQLGLPQAQLRELRARVDHRPR